MTDREHPITVLMMDFKSEHDIQRWWKDLVDSGLSYHLDDDPSDIVWDGGDLDDGTKAIIESNHDAMWSYCRGSGISPWDHFDALVEPDTYTVVDRMADAIYEMLRAYDDDGEKMTEMEIGAIVEDAREALLMGERKRHHMEKKTT